RWILVDVNLPFGGGADGMALTLVENPAIRPNGRAYGIKGMSLIGWDRSWGAWDVSDDGDVALVTTASMVAEDTGAGYGLDAYLWRRPKQGAQGTWQLLTQDENGQAVNSNGVGAGIAVSSN